MTVALGRKLIGAMLAIVGASILLADMGSSDTGWTIFVVGLALIAWG